MAYEEGGAHAPTQACRTAGAFPSRTGVSLFRRRSSPDAGVTAAVDRRDNGSDPQPVDGYDGLKAEKVVAMLKGYSQVELAAIESYERSHADRQVVLDKLRYLRTDEPLANYDELEPDAIAAALKGADADTLMRVREYERKFKRRDAVLATIIRAGQDNGRGGRAVADSG